MAADDNHCPVLKMDLKFHRNPFPLVPCALRKLLLEFAVELLRGFDLLDLFYLFFSIGIPAKGAEVCQRDNFLFKMIPPE